MPSETTSLCPKHGQMLVRGATEGFRVLTLLLVYALHFSTCTGQGRVNPIHPPTAPVCRAVWEGNPVRMGYLELYNPQDIYCPQEEWDKGHTIHKSVGGVSGSFGPVLLAIALQPQKTGL